MTFTINSDFRQRNAVKNLFILILALVFSCKSGGWIRPGFSDQESEAGRNRINTGNENTQEQPEIGRVINLYPETRQYEEEPLYNKDENKKKVENSKKEKKKKKKRIPIYYSGNRFIRENKVHDFIGEKMVVMTILGNGKVKRKSSVLYSPRIEVLGEDGMIALAHKSVKIVDPEEGTVITGGYGEYFKYEETAYIKISPKIVHTGKEKRKTVITSELLERDLAQKISICHRNVIIRSKDFIAFSQKATYYESKDIMVLEGDPRIFEKDNIYIADKMTLYNEKDEAFLEGHVQLIITEKPDEAKEAEDTGEHTRGDSDLQVSEKKKISNKNKPDKKNEKNGKGIVTTIIYSDFGLYEFGPTVYLGKKVTFYMNKKRSVVIERPDSKTYCKNLETWGDGPAEGLATFDVRTLYYEDGTIVLSEYARYYRALGRAVIDTDRNLQGDMTKPLVFFFDKERLPAGMLEAKKIERNLINERIQARGDVKIHLFKEDDERVAAPFAPADVSGREVYIYPTNALITGEWAELFQEKGREVHVYGNSAVRHDNSKIFARKIILYPDTKRFEMLGSIHGEM